MSDLIVSGDHTSSAASRGIRLDSIQEESVDVYRTAHTDENTHLTSLSVRRNDVVEDEHQSIIRIGFSMDGSSRVIEVPRSIGDRSGTDHPNAKRGILLDSTIDDSDQHSLGTPRIIHEQNSSRLTARISSLLAASPHVEDIDAPLQILSKQTINKLGKASERHELPDLEAYTIEPNASLTDPTTSQSLGTSDFSSKRCFGLIQIQLESPSRTLIRPFRICRSWFQWFQLLNTLLPMILLSQSLSVCYPLQSFPTLYHRFPLSTLRPIYLMHLLEKTT